MYSKNVSNVSSSWFSNARNGEVYARTAAAVVAWVVATCSPTLDARITKIQVTSTESPTFAGTSFGAVGQYEKIAGKAFGTLDPKDAKNAVIVDLSLAPRNANGLVEYSMDFLVLKPLDLMKGNKKLFYEVNNRGNKYFSLLNGYNVNILVSGPLNNPTTAADAGDGFLMKQGYALAWSGWDTSAPRVPVCPSPYPSLRTQMAPRS